MIKRNSIDDATVEEWTVASQKVMGLLPESFKSHKALDVQVAGNHYKDMKIQVVEYCMANKIPYMEGNVIKYVSRWRAKGGIEDLKKARHYLDLLIEQETESK